MFDADGILQAVLDSIPIGVLIVDPDGRVLLFNAAAERIIGANPRSVKLIDISDRLADQNTEKKVAIIVRPVNNAKGIAVVVLQEKHVELEQEVAKWKSVEAQKRNLEQHVSQVQKMDAVEEKIAIQASQDHVSGHETILLVDDNQPVREAVGAMLRMYGYRVLEAGDGQEALERARMYPDPIHLLITDVVMPRMSGSELVRHLTQERTEIKVLFMSGYSHEAVRSYGVHEKGAAFLNKPAAMATLLSKIREVLSSS